MGAPLISVGIRGWLIPEDWPLSSFSLFAWSGSHWDSKLAVFHTGDTRLILMTDSRINPMGLPVLTSQMRKSDQIDAQCAFNGFYACFDETNIQHSIFQALDMPHLGGAGWDAKAFVEGIDLWLQKGR